jgi:hypothetical protein
MFRNAPERFSISLDSSNHATAMQLTNSPREQTQPIQNQFSEIIAREWRMQRTTDFLAPIAPMHLSDATFAEQVQLASYDLSPTRVAPGGSVAVTLYWRALTDVPEDYIAALNLLDAHSESFYARVAEPFFGKLPFSLWRRGTILPEQFEIKVPPRAHPGLYRIELGLLKTLDHDTILSLADGRDRFLLDPILVTQDKNAAPTHPLAVNFDSPVLVALRGYDLVRESDALRVTLHWQAARPVPADYSVFAHLVDANGQIVSQHDGAPQNGNAPTSWFAPDQIVADSFTMPLPGSGRYTLRVGLYDAPSGARLPVFDGANQSLGDAYEISLEGF